jgi:murein DD-endopeptidase MepM/ murein hydrolase activator NlpD
MKVRARQFNLYLAIIAALVFTCGCQSDKNDKDKQTAALRIHLETGPGSPDTSQTISVLRSDPVSVAIATDPILTEANVIAAKIIDAPGGFAIEIKFDESATWMLEHSSAANPGKHFAIFGQWGEKIGRPLAGRAAHHAPHRRRRAGVHARLPRAEADQLCSASTTSPKNPQGLVQMIFPARRAIFFFAAPVLFSCASLFAQSPFQFPTANHALYEIGSELKFFAPTAPDKPWTSGSFGCVRDNGTRMHEGLDIRHLHDRRGEPTDPVMATADGTVVYFSKKPSLSNYGNYIVIRHVVEGMEIYSLYAHLSALRSGLKIGAQVKAGEVIATMGRTSNAEVITKERAHVHFELNVLLNDNFAGWFKKNSTGERNDHGEWNGQNLNGLDPREILIAEHNPVKKFSLLNFLAARRNFAACSCARRIFPI